MINFYKRKNIIRLLLSTVFLIGAWSANAQTPVDYNGKLKLVGNQLSSECGNPVQLKGMSTHGPQWFEGCYTEEALDVMQNDWNASIFRLAMYVESGGYLNDPVKWRNWIDRWVDETEKRGMYCLIDWHILSDGNPMKNVDAAIEFWDYMSKKHAGKKHVLYEICNEPNGEGGDWSNIKSYAETIIPVIRANDPETVIMVGTPTWSGTPWDVVNDKLTGDNAYNVMYSYHFYSGSHGDRLDLLSRTLSDIPIFVTEWGTSDASGNSGFNEAVTNAYMDVFNGNNPAGIKVSWCNWSFADKDETSAALSPGACGSREYNNTSQSGTLVKRHMQEPNNFMSCSPEPNFSTQPQTQTAKLGESATFTVRATGESLTYQWRRNGVDIPGATENTFTIENVSESDFAIYTVVISNSHGSLESESAELRLWQEGPYHGAPLALPGRLQAQDYDIGGQNESYYDASVGNDGGAFRDDDVDIERTSDAEGSYNVGWTAVGEWLNYTVDVQESGVYNFEFRVATANNNGGSMSISFDGNEVATVDVPNTSGWQNWQTVTVEGVELTAGTQVMRLEYTAGEFNFNYVDAELVEETPEEPAENEAPSVSITAPSNNAEFEAGDDITITADASDSDGEVVLVEFFSNGDKIGESASAPFTFAWANTEEGTYTLTAVAHDNEGAITTSAEVVVVVNPEEVENIAPVVAITSPADNTEFEADENIEITADASDSDGEIVLVEFFNNGMKVGEANSEPYTITLENAQEGTFELTAVAYDNDGAEASSDVVLVVVNPAPVNVAPEVSITSPEANEIFTLGNDIVITAEASDSDGNIERVVFYNGENRIGVAESSPFVYTWTNAPVGTYNLIAVAFDNDEASANSEPVAISVIAEGGDDDNEDPEEPVNVAPLVSITSPVTGDEYTVGDNVNIEINATDEDGNVARVELLLGTTIITELTEQPYVFTLTDVQEGSFAFTAVAYDNEGASSTSDEVVINVVAEEEEEEPTNELPEVAFASPVSGDEFIVGDDVEIIINATDADGEVVRVEIFNGETRIAELAEAPFTYIWADVLEGSYSLTAVAFDNNGGSSVSDEVAISVVAEEEEEEEEEEPVEPENELPVVAILNPVHDYELEAGSALVIEAEASDSDGHIEKVEFYYADKIIATLDSGPYTVTWNQVPVGRHGLRAIAYDNEGGSSVSEEIWIDAVQSLEEGPFGGIAHAVPGVIEAEAYDLGGNGVAYNDLSEGNQGGAYRHDDVDIGFNHESGVYSVGWIEDGEWLNYTIDVQATGVYDFYFNVATDQDDRSFEILVDGETVIESVVVPNTGEWNVWESVRIRGVELEAGEHVMQLLVQNSAFNINYIEVKDGSETEPNIAPEISLTSPAASGVFNPDVNIQLSADASDSDGTIARVVFMVDGEEFAEATEEPYRFTWENVPAGVYEISAVAVDNESARTSSETVTVTVLEEATTLPYGGVAHIVPGKIEAEDYDEGGNDVSYNDNSEGNAGGAYRYENVDIGYNPESDITSVGWIEDGEWLNYTINVETAGIYDFTFNVATELDGKGFAVLIDGEEVVSNAVVPNTGGWNTWSTMTIRGVELEAGEQVMQIFMHGGEINLDYIEINDGSETQPNMPPVVSIVNPANNTTLNPGSDINISVEAIDYDGFVVNVEFFIGENRVGIAEGAPYEFTVEDLEPGTYELTVRARDNEGASSVSEPVIFEVRETAVSLPYGGVAHALPGVVETEDYDEGGQEIAYFDNSRGNMGGAYRQDNVDIGFSPETGINSVGWTEDMEWLNYTVNVTEAGVYDFKFRVATPVSGMALAIDMNDEIVIDRAEVPNTGEWNAWDVVTVRGVELTEGEQIMRLTFIGGDVNIDNIEVVPSTGDVDDGNDDEDPVVVDPVDPSDCVVNATPSESDWVSRNDWADQYSGSFFANNGDELEYTHRAWGRQYAWLIETGKSFAVEEGEEYTITFDAKTGEGVPATAVQVGLALGAMWDRADLLQAAYDVKESVSNEYTTYTVSFTAEKSGEVNLALRFDWGVQHNRQVVVALRNIEVCGAEGYEKMAVATENNIEVYPNPVVDVAQVDIKSESEVTVFGMDGKVVYGPVKHNGLSPLNIDLANAPQGIYILNSKSSTGTKTKKIIKY